MDEDLKQLVEKNLELTERIARDVRKMRHHFWMANVWSIVKILILIVLPVYLGYRYITPYMGQLQSAYEQLLDIQKGVQGFQQNVGDLQKNLGSIQGAAKQIQDLQKKMPNTGGNTQNFPSIPGLDFLFKKN